VLYFFVFLVKQIKILTVLGCRKLTYYTETEPKINTLLEELTLKISSESVCSGYLFGFNGKENDNEIKGDGNSLDFGARIYDSRLGRWLSLDPEMKNYPNMSPYNYCANNPIKFVDFGGKDYGVYINHDDKTITIKATLYTTESGLKDAQSSAMAWNNQSGTYQYKVGEGTAAMYYDVKFEISVVQEPKFEDTQNQWINNIEGNTFQTVPSRIITCSDGSTAFGTTENEPGITRKGGSIISVGRKNQKMRGSGSHEIGHILGVGHWIRGLMKDGRKNSEQQITKGMIQQVLKNVGLNTGQSLPVNDTQTQVNQPVMTKTDVTGTAPSDFQSGTVDLTKGQTPEQVKEMTTKSL